MRYLILLFCLFTSVGCSSQYFYNRSRDIAEPFTFNFCVGPSATFGVKATGGIHFLLGGGKHAELGLYQGYFGHSEVDSKGIPLIWAYPPENYNGEWMDVRREASWADYRYPGVHSCTGSHIARFHQENPRADLKRCLDLEVTNTLFIGYRIGFSIIEFFDFASGLIGFDPSGDDDVIEEYINDDTEDDN